MTSRTQEQIERDPYGYEVEGNFLAAEGREMAGVTYEEDKYRQMEERSKNSLSGFFYNY